MRIDEGLTICISSIYLTRGCGLTIFLLSAIVVGTDVLGGRDAHDWLSAGHQMMVLCHPPSLQCRVRGLNGDSALASQPQCPTIQFPHRRMPTTRIRTDPTTPSTTMIQTHCLEAQAAGTTTSPLTETCLMISRCEALLSEAGGRLTVM